MNLFNTQKDFYPTPSKLLEKITCNYDWRHTSTILEPSAGKGDIALFCKDKINSLYLYDKDDIDIDCIELDSELRNILKANELRTIHDDFLTFDTYKKYDLIFMNPPFSSGERHLLKAIELQKNGGSIICILNAETIKNPYTNERKVLLQKLEELNAEIEFMENEFTSAEHSTSVEIAIIKIYIPEKKHESLFYNELKEKKYQENVYENITDIAPNDFIKSIVRMFELEVECGIKLIHEYKAMEPRILNSFNNKYAHPILELKLGNKTLSTNEYVKIVREKYWTALFKDKRFTGNMTRNLAEEYSGKVRELKNYDFSEYNIKVIQLEMSKELINGIEKCIYDLFDELSRQFSFPSEKNIHYFNGWCTNRCYYINKKVILPHLNAYSSYSGRFEPDYKCIEKLADIEKALNYLDGSISKSTNINEILEQARIHEQTKNIQCRHFSLTFYKKGTCHIEFTNEDLWKKFNIFGAKGKRWLPPSYGQKSYNEMSEEEKHIIDEFEGKESYCKVMSNKDYYIYNPSKTLNLLETSA